MGDREDGKASLSSGMDNASVLDGKKLSFPTLYNAYAFIPLRLFEVYNGRDTEHFTAGWNLRTISSLSWKVMLVEMVSIKYGNI